MIGGIYCEANIGTVFKDGQIISIKQQLKKLFGDDSMMPSGKELSDFVVNYFYNDISGKMAKVLSSWQPPTNRGYYNRTVDLTRSICLGVYHNGALKRMYRFTGGHRERGLFQPSDLGTNTSPSATYRMEILSKMNHPDPAERAYAFLQDYDLFYKSGFSFVIAATMPYAVRLEVGYSLPVLKLVVNRMLTGLYEFKGNSNKVLYGYVFESSGGFA